MQSRKRKLSSVGPKLIVNENMLPPKFQITDRHWDPGVSFGCAKLLLGPTVARDCGRRFEP